MRIVPMTLFHIGKLVELEKICFSHPWTANGFISELDKDGANFFVAEAVTKSAPGEVLGYFGLNTVLDEGYIANIAVFPEHRSKGVASELIQHAISYAAEQNLMFLSLEVRESNNKAISLYERFSFEPVGLRKNFYSNPQENGVVMTRNIKKTDKNDTAS